MALELEQEIQRVPAGLANVLNLFGGIMPAQLARQNFGVLDLLQFYGLQQKSVPFALNGALATSGSIDLLLTPESSWGVLFCASFSYGYVVGVGNAQSEITLQRGSGGVFQSRRFVEGVNIAAGGELLNAWEPQYVMLLPPSSTLRGTAFFTGGGTVSAGLSAEIGLFG